MSDFIQCPPKFTDLCCKVCRVRLRENELSASRAKRIPPQCPYCGSVLFKIKEHARRNHAG